MEMSELNRLLILSAHSPISGAPAALRKKRSNVKAGLLLQVGVLPVHVDRRLTVFE